MKLFKVQKWTKTETPENRQGFHGEEVRINNLTNLSEYLECSHHNTRLFGLDTLHHWHNLFLDSILVENLAAAELGRVLRNANTIETVTDGVFLSRTTTQGVEGFKTTNFDTKRVCVREDTRDHWEQLILDSTVI